METQPEKTCQETNLEEVLQQKVLPSSLGDIATTMTTTVVTPTTARPPPPRVSMELKRYPPPPPVQFPPSTGAGSSMGLSELRAAVEGGVAAHPVKLIAGRHALVRSKREETDREISEKREQVKLCELNQFP